MNYARYLLTGFLGLWTLVGGSAVAQGPTSAGKALYLEYGCYQCHGTVGQGAYTGPRLAPEVLPYEAFKLLVRYPSKRMPAYPKANLKENDLRTIHEYLTTIASPPGVADIPLLRERRDRIKP